MMRTASEKGRSWTLLYCNRCNEDAPFLAEIEALGGEMSLHSSDSGTRLDVAQRLGSVQEDTLIYCCGPERLMTAVREEGGVQLYRELLDLVKDKSVVLEEYATRMVAAEAVHIREMELMLMKRAPE
jgi:NAD(P)H-flavin reductase